MRPVLFLLLVIGGLLVPLELALKSGSAATPAVEQTASAPPPPAVCATNADWPGSTPVVVLPFRPGGYGGIQYLRTPLPPRTIALTFDDGPDPSGSPKAFEILEARCLKATFFYVGYYAALRPDLVQSALSHGHGVASHSWSHPTQLRYWSLPAGKAEIDRSFVALRTAAGTAGPVEPFFRFPGLNNSPALRSWLGGQGITVVSAEAGTDDWRGISSEAIYQRTLARMEEAGGGVLILHETRPNMMAVLPRLLDELNRRGFRFVRISASPDASRTASAANAQPAGEGAARPASSGLQR
jgi:peptidoglycan-N-acetylglucosamine deacetylase